MHLVKRTSTLFALLRGSSLSPISLPSNLSDTHSALCAQAQWGDRVLKSSAVNDILSEMDTSTILWMESNDSHVLLVTTEYSDKPLQLGAKMFRHFATFRYKKSGRS